MFKRFKLIKVILIISATSLVFLFNNCKEGFQSNQVNSLNIDPFPPEAYEEPPLEQPLEPQEIIIPVDPIEEISEEPFLSNIPEKSFIDTLYNKYYRFSEQVYIKDKLIESADLYSFVSIIDGYIASDKNNVYCYDQVISGLDVNSIELISHVKKGIYFKDQSQVLYVGEDKKCQVLADVDPLTFRAFNPEVDQLEIFLDKDAVYKDGQKLAGIHAETFEYLDPSVPEYTRDKYKVYFNLEPMPNIDRDSFVLFAGTAYAKDKVNVYYRRNPVDGLNPNIFSRFAQSNYYIEGARVIYEGKVVPEVNGATLKRISDSYYYTDGINLVVDGLIYEDRDLNSFRAEKGWFGRDNEKAYFKGKDIWGVDLNTYKIINENFALDVSKVYGLDKKITVGDPESFTCKDSENCEDNRNWYRVEEDQVIISLKPRN